MNIKPPTIHTPIHKKLTPLSTMGVKVYAGTGKLSPPHVASSNPHKKKTNAGTNMSPAHPEEKQTSVHTDPNFETNARQDEWVYRVPPNTYVSN
jgi:hypothetical protein